MKEEYIYIPKLSNTVKYTIGTNAKDNFDIIDKSNINDIWFHVDDKPSCHVICTFPETINKLNKKTLNQIIKQGAIICKKYSKYSLEENLSIVYTRIQYVRKTEIIGSVNISNSKTIIC